MTSEAFNIMEIDEKEFYSEEGDKPIAALMGLHRSPTSPTLIGYTQVLSVLQQIVPDVPIKKEVCQGITAPDGEYYATAPDIMIIVLAYTDQRSRAMTIKFYEESATLH